MKPMKPMTSILPTNPYDWIRWFTRISKTSLAVTAMAVFGASYLAFSSLGIGLRDTVEIRTRRFFSKDFQDLNFRKPDSRIRSFGWDEPWRRRTGRLSPGVEDWREIFAAIRALGATQVVIPEESIFSRVNATTPGYLDVFREAAAAGMKVYAPLRFVDPRPGVISADPLLFGTPVERFIQDPANSRQATTLMDLQKIPDISHRILVGPSPEFADVLAGYGLVGGDSDFLMPIARWREDRFVADLALTPREPLLGASISNGRVMVGVREVAIHKGLLAAPALSQRDFLAFAPESIDALLEQGKSDGQTQHQIPLMVIVGSADSPLLSRLAVISSASLDGIFSIPVSNWSPFAITLMAVIGLLIAMINKLAAAMILGLIWTGLCFVGALWTQHLTGLSATSAALAVLIPFLFELIKRSARRDARMDKIGLDLSATQIAKSAMARQARMIVHDLRRIVKLKDSQNLAYLDGFLVELTALEQDQNLIGHNPTRKSFSVLDITEASLAALLPSFEGRGVDFKTTWGHRSKLCGDPVAMRRIVDNLLDNAAAASPRSSVIQILTSEDITNNPNNDDNSTPCCLLTVSNVAPDFSAADFSVFVEGRIRGRKESRGLGLVIIKRLAESMGGLVRYNHVPATGILTIEVSIPVDRGLPDMNLIMRSGPLSGLRDQMLRRRLLVVVDDSPFVRDMWERQSNDADIIVFGTPDEFLVNLAEDVGILSRSPILVTDYQFDGGGMDGVALAQRARLAGVLDIVICSDWDLSHLESGVDFPVIRKRDVSLAGVMSALQKPSA